MNRDRSSVHIDVGLGRQSEPARERSSDDPFRIALVGDFGGRANRRAPRGNREPVEIDPDNFEEVMARLETGLELTAGERPVALRFRELDDFHPDHLYASLPLFQTLRQTRAELANPATFRAMAARLRPDPTSSPGAPIASPSAPAGLGGGSLLDQIAEQTAAAQQPALESDESWDNVIRRIVTPHLTPKADARQDELVGQVDAATGAVLRAILGHPDFQALEAAWRSIFFLLQRLETGVELKLYLIDLTREELMEAAHAGRPLTRDGWSVAACLDSFSPGERDCGVLAGLAGIARQAGGPLLGGMDPRLVGCESIAAAPDPDDWKKPLDKADAEAWRQLRHHPDARWLGLAMPRFLLRLPYGRKTSPVEAFDFEEMPQAPAHEAYLWGSPAVVCACLIGQAFNRRRWQLHPGLVSEVDGLPVHTYRRGSESLMTPPAETWLTDRVAERIADEGVMPLASSKNGDSALLMRFQSVADPPAPLAGPWE
ncbi:MAG: type VI secretion system contractile sheath large subunit [Bryobacteraceae bacterium]